MRAAADRGWFQNQMARTRSHHAKKKGQSRDTRHVNSGNERVGDMVTHFNYKNLEGLGTIMPFLCSPFLSGPFRGAIKNTK